MKAGRWLGLLWAGLAALFLTACGGGAGATYNSIIINFVDTATPTQVEQVASKYGISPRLNSPSRYAQSEVLYQFPIDPSQPDLAAKLLRALAGESLVQYVEPNYLYSTSLVPNDQMYSQQWNLEAIHMPAAWDTTAGAGVTVAVIDTGVTRVPDLAETELVPGYDFVDDDEDASDLQGHGTHVTGTIAQSTNNSYGVAGVAYQAKIMPVRVLDANGFGTVADIAEGIRFAADNGATIINMSLGGRMPAQLMQDAVEYAHKKGVTIVAAAGNESSDGSSYPARYDHVISVSALGPTGEKAPYSNYGVGVDISAPGGAKTEDHPEWGVLQQTISRRNPNEAEFAYFQGTSMAAPHVAGVAALIQSQGVTDPDKVEEVLKRSSTPVAGDKLNYYGSGRLNAEQAVARLKQQEDENPLVLWGKDFLKYLSDNGYLNPRFWLDGGAIALVPKLLMVIGGYIVLILIRWWLAPKGFGLSLPLLAGILFGSSGLFVFRGLAVVDAPRWPLQVLGSSLPELGTAWVQSSALNPLFASALLPTIGILLFLGHPWLRWLAIGLTMGVAAHLLVSGTAFYGGLLWFGSAAWFGRSFLLVNGLLCLWLAYLAVRAVQSPFSGLAVRK